MGFFYCIKCKTCQVDFSLLNFQLAAVYLTGLCFMIMLSSYLNLLCNYRVYR